MPEYVKLHCRIALILHISKIMLKILQTRLQQYMNQELSEVQVGFWRDRGTRDQIANIHWVMEKVREFQKKKCFIDYIKFFDCVDHNKQEATVRTRHGTTNWFQNRERNTARLYIITLLI
uniref:Uncharacterized protein n=1 Tax=Micrurus carvalhoi TaxID=3147026 RepID=A0A2H6NIE5_9SAUR